MASYWGFQHKTWQWKGWWRAERRASIIWKLEKMKRNDLHHHPKQAARVRRPRSAEGRTDCRVELQHRGWILRTVAPLSQVYSLEIRVSESGSDVWQVWYVFLKTLHCVFCTRTKPRTGWNTAPLWFKASGWQLQVAPLTFAVSYY